MKQHDEVEVAVRGIAVGGAGVGKVVGPEGGDAVGMTAFVPFAAPGETVRAQVIKRQARFLEADLVAVAEPSPDRADPPCPYFGTCGGCDIQHLTYPAQVAAKTEMVRGAFVAGGLTGAAERLAEPVAPGPPLRYRQRITLHVGGDGALGYFRRRSHTLLPVADCPISVSPIGAFLGEGFTLSGVLPPLTPPARFWGDMEVEAGQDGRLYAVLWLREPLPQSRRTARAVAARLGERFAGGRVMAGGEVLARFGTDDPATQQRATPGAIGAFSQVNAAVNAALVAALEAFAVRTEARTAEDLYAGAGNFALPLAARGIPTVAVEADARLVQAGQNEAARRGLAGRVSFHLSPVEEYLRLRSAGPVDLLIADPPRAGLGREIVARLGHARDIALLSCHLPAAVRDLKDLQGEGWAVESVTPFDMFPQTAHVELLTTLRRGEG